MVSFHLDREHQIFPPIHERRNINSTFPIPSAATGKGHIPHGSVSSEIHREKYIGSVKQVPRSPSSHHPLRYNRHRWYETLPFHHFRKILSSTEISIQVEKSEWDARESMTHMESMYQKHFHIWWNTPSETLRRLAPHCSISTLVSLQDRRLLSIHSPRRKQSNVASISPSLQKPS